MILLFSGGIDSYIAWYYLDKPKTLYFNLGTPYTEKERAVVRKLLPFTTIDYSLNLKDRQVGENAYVPFRNLYLAMLACKYSDTIVIAGVKDDDVSDKNEQIFQKFSDILSEMENRPIKVLSPFWNMTKENIVAWYVNEVNYGRIKENLGHQLVNTISCYSYVKGNYCGTCPSCFRKWCALRANDIYFDFYNIPLMMEYLKKAEEGHYIPERNTNIIKCVKGYLNI